MTGNPTPIRAAVIGTGFMGRVHLEALRRIPNVDAVAIAGTSLAKANALGAGYGIAHVSDDWRAIVADPGIDATFEGVWELILWGLGVRQTGI